jgi:hypothetical protein
MSTSPGTSAILRLGVEARAYGLSSLQGIVTFAYSALLVGLLAGSSGGFGATTWGWTAVATLALAAIAVVVTDKVELSVLDFVFAGGLLAFASWVALSSFWSPSVTSSLHEAQRDIAYVGVVAAGLLLTRRRTVAHLLGGLLAAVTLLSLYALGTRLLPDHLGTYVVHIADYRLATPIPYWNGLGIFTVMGMLLALGLAARGQRLVSRGLAAATIPPLAMTLEFTFSRGAWAALAVGFVVAVAVDRRRLQLLAVALVLAPWPALAVALASHKVGLTVAGSSLQRATADGHALVVPLALLVAASALGAVVAGLVERRVPIPGTVRLAFAAVMIAILVAGIGATWVKRGSPLHVAHSAWQSFRSPPLPDTADESQRLFQLSSNGRLELWRVSWKSFERHPVLGNGAGTFWQLWAKKPAAPFSATDGHSLYAETLGELGIIGLGLLLIALVAPLVALGRSRSVALAAPAAGAYCAWLVHAGIDWVWELTGVSAVALLCGVALVRGASRGERSFTLRKRAPFAAVLAVLALVAVPALVADTLVRNGNEARANHPAEAVRDARRARLWAPWSSEPYQLEGRALEAEGSLEPARSALRSAIRRDSSSWVLWQQLADVSRGPARAVALAKVGELNPP